MTREKLPDRILLIMCSRDIHRIIKVVINNL